MPKITVLIPKSTKQYHYVWTIYRHSTNKDAVESFNKEVGEFLDAGYTCLGAGMDSIRIYAVMAKLIFTDKQSGET